MSLCVLMYRRSSESRMRSGTRRGVSKWSRRKDRYIGRLYSEFGKVPSDSGIFRSTGELREFAGDYMGLRGRERGAASMGRAPPPPSGLNWTRRGAAPPQGLVRIGLGGGAAPPPSFSSLPPFLDSYSYYLEGGNPTPGGSRTPQGAP